MRIVILILILILLILQYRLWVGEGSLAEVHALKQEIELQRKALGRLEERNAALQAEVEDLKQGIEEIEARARSELGMIREGELFYQIIETPKEPEE